MFTQSFPVTVEKQFDLKVDGDLDLRGWGKPEFSASVLRESDLRITTEDDRWVVESSGDLEMWIPEGISIRVIKVEGDADIQDLTGQLVVHGVGGDLELTSVGETRVDSVGGDLDAKKIASLAITAVGGDCSVSRITGAVEISHIGGDMDAEDLGSLKLINVGGDCTANKISGEFSVSNIGGDLDGENLQARVSTVTVGGDLALRVKSGGIKAMAGGDLDLRLDELAAEPVELSAGGDVDLHLPAQANAKMHITSGGRDILMRVGGWNERVEMFVFDFTLGEGTTPIQITAGGDVVVTDGSPQTNKEGSPFEFAGIKVDVDAITRTVQEKVERATQQAENASREIEERIQAAMRRVEEKTRGRTFRMGFEAQPPASPVPPVDPIKPAAPVQPSGNKVSDEERRLILQMLAEQKISADEAIQLLDALEGKSQ